MCRNSVARRMAHVVFAGVPLSHQRGNRLAAAGGRAFQRGSAPKVKMLEISGLCMKELPESQPALALFARHDYGS